MRHAAVTAGALVLALPAVAAAQTPSGPPFEFLRARIGYTEDELRAVADGQAVTKVLETSERREIAIAGAVRIGASTSFFLRMYRAIESFDTAAQASRELSDPPQPADFAAMDIPDEDLAALSACRPGKCGMKLGDETLARVQQEVDWNDPGAPGQAQRILQEQALAFLLAYREGGNAALGGYRDRKHPEEIAGDFDALLANAPYVLDYRPELHRYLVDYPRASLEGAGDFFYWGRYDYGKPVIRVNHVTVYPTEAGDNGSAIIAVKHLWYTHYFTTGLDLHVLVRDPTSEADAFYLVTLTRMRTDGVGGMFGGLLKKTVAGSVLENVQAYLGSLTGAVERYYAAEVEAR